MKKDFLVPVMLCASFSCQANDYFFQPLISSSERYTSNLLLRPTSTGNWISKLSPGLNAGLRTENVDLKSNFTWNQLFYTNDTALNISEQLFNVDYAHRRGRLQWGLDGSFNNQSSLNSLSTVQGLAFTQVMAKQLNIAPTVSYSLNELSSLTFNYSYSNTNYEKSSSSFLTIMIISRCQVPISNSIRNTTRLMRRFQVLVIKTLHKVEPCSMKLPSWAGNTASVNN